MNLNDPTAITTELKATSDTSPGWKTTEFWIHVPIIIGLVLASFEGALPPQYAAIAVVVSQGCYSLSRGLAKQGNSN